ncbi:MAG: hypothetical protein AAGH78_01205 [Cyanobacteria bacterium P01_H01_bin.58]
MLNIWQGQTLLQSSSIVTAPIGEIRFAPPCDRILASPHCFNLADSHWEDLPSLKSALVEGLDENPSGRYTVSHAAWDSTGGQLVVACDYRSPRRSRQSARHSSTWAGPSQRLLLLEGTTRKLIKVLWQGNPSETFKAIAISPDFIVAAGQAIQVWNRQADNSPYELHSKPLTSQPAVIRALRFSADYRYLAQIRSDGHIALWQTQPWQILHEWQGHKNEGRAISFHPHLPILASGGWDDCLKLWNYQGNLLENLTLEHHIEGLEFSPQGEQLIVAQGGTASRLLVYQVMEAVLATQV